MKKIIIYNLLIIIALGGCKKVDLEPTVSDTPVFLANAILENDSLNLIAGDDDIYMFSEFSKDTFDVYTMTGRFAKDSSCQSDCEESLSFSIRSNSATPSVSDFNIEDAISPNSSLSYFKSNPTNSILGYNYFFDAERIDSFSQTQADSFYWEITGDSFSFNSLEDTFSLMYFGQTDLDVRLELTTSNGCTSYIQKSIPLGLIDNCDLRIDGFSTGNLEYILLPVSNSGLSNFSWVGFNFLDSLTIDSTTIIPPNGLFELIASDNNQTCLVQLGICPEFQPSGIMYSFSYPNINYSVDTLYINNPTEQFSTVTIEYQNATGTYLSNNVDNSNNTFTITKVENYEDNENGENTKKLTIEYDCILKEEVTGETKNISGTAEIAVAYPG